MQRHRHQEFIRFLNYAVEREVGGWQDCSLPHHN